MLLKAMLSSTLFALNLTAPNLLLMLLGFYLYKNKSIDNNFVNVASNFVFKYCLPCLLFFSVLKSDMHIREQLNLINAGLLCTFILFFSAEIYAKIFIKELANQGVFVQGVFRANMGIMGMTFVLSAYGEQALGMGALYVGILIMVFNVLGIITLSRTDTNAGMKKKLINTIKKIATNPLVIALVLAFFYKILEFPPLPEFLQKSGGLLANITLPLALICAGASVDTKAMFSITGVSMQASIGRVVIAPILSILIGLYFELPPMQFGVFFIMNVMPTAAVSYMMAKAMGGNANAAANIIASTSVFSMLSLAVGMAILRSLGLV